MTTRTNMMVVAMMVLLVVAILAVVAFTTTQGLMVDWDLPGTMRYCVGSGCTL